MGGTESSSKGGQNYSTPFPPKQGMGGTTRILPRCIKKRGTEYNPPPALRATSSQTKVWEGLKALRKWRDKPHPKQGMGWTKSLRYENIIYPLAVLFTIYKFRNI